MKSRSVSRAFTIIELLVVVSIIALLIGILLPAIGKARDQANLTRSQSNVRQLGAAAATYSAEWSDRQMTYVDDNFSRYGANGVDACLNYVTQHAGFSHPHMILGADQGGITWIFGLPNDGAAFVNGWRTIVPIDFDPASRFGVFRLINGRQFSQYLNSRFYDPIFYAPKDTAVMNSVEPWLDHPSEFTVVPGNAHKWSSYCFSPAGMFSPDVLSETKGNHVFYKNPFSLQAGFRSPAMSQAQYPDLKTHIMEHNWLQNRKRTCNPMMTGSRYDGCEPYYFNAASDSAPVTLFYDGHIEGSGTRDSELACFKMIQQTGQPHNGLWSIDTPMGGDYGNADNGYFSTESYDWTATSYHILTIDGIKGRDFLPR